MAHFCHLSLTVDNSTDLWNECQNGPCRCSKLMEQFSYLTIATQGLLAQQEEKAKALCSGEAAKMCKVAGRCGCSHRNGDSWLSMPTCAPQLPQNKAGYSEEESF